MSPTTTASEEAEENRGQLSLRMVTARQWLRSSARRWKSGDCQRHFVLFCFHVLCDTDTDSVSSEKHLHVKLFLLTRWSLWINNRIVKYAQEGFIELSESFWCANLITAAPSHGKVTAAWKQLSGESATWKLGVVTRRQLAHLFF